MTKSRRHILLHALLSLTALAGFSLVALSSPRKKAVETQSDNEPAAVWHDPGEVASLNLFYGPGGKDHAPDANGIFHFLREDMSGTSPKFDVKDDNGNEWRVKLGMEPKSETAATRLLWAAGYFTDEDYFLPQLKVQGLSKLRRGDNLVSSDGIVRTARLELRIKTIKKVGTWDWFHNQCGSSQELNGLRIMMAFLNNWDLKAVNNAVEESDGQRRCVVTDVGATLGRTGSTLTRSKSVEEDYANSRFIAKATPQYVDFVLHSRPPFIDIVDPFYFRERSHMEGITKHIPVADAKWLAQRLALLSASQIRDCFRAAGYSQEEIDGYTTVVQDRISQLNGL